MELDKYYMGKWISQCSGVVWGDNVEQDDFLKSQGYSTHGKKYGGTIYEPHYTIYEYDGYGNECLVDIYLNEDVVYMFKIDDMPSRLMFMKEYSSIFKRKDESGFAPYGRLTDCSYLNKNSIKSVEIKTRTDGDADVVAYDNDGRSFILFHQFPHDMAREYINENFYYDHDN